MSHSATFLPRNESFDEHCWSSMSYTIGYKLVASNSVDVEFDMVELTEADDDTVKNDLIESIFNALMSLYARQKTLLLLMVKSQCCETRKLEKSLLIIEVLPFNLYVLTISHVSMSFTVLISICIILEPCKYWTIEVRSLLFFDFVKEVDYVRNGFC